MSDYGRDVDVSSLTSMSYLFTMIGKVPHAVDLFMSDVDGVLIMDITTTEMSLTTVVDVVSVYLELSSVITAPHTLTAAVNYDSVAMSSQVSITLTVMFDYDGDDWATRILGGYSTAGPYTVEPLMEEEMLTLDNIADAVINHENRVFNATEIVWYPSYGLHLSNVTYDHNLDEWQVTAAICLIKLYKWHSSSSPTIHSSLQCSSLCSCSSQ